MNTIDFSGLSFTPVSEITELPNEQQISLGIYHHSISPENGRDFFAYCDDVYWIGEIINGKFIFNAHGMLPAIEIFPEWYSYLPLTEKSR